MITSEGPHGRFVIATPTKCGTTTLEECARRHGGGRVSRGGVEVPSFRIMSWEQPRRQHRMVPPPGWENADRYIVVRNPFARWVSVYEYMRNPANYSKWGAKEINGREWLGLEKGRGSAFDAAVPMTFVDFLWYVVDMRMDYGEPRWVKRRGHLHSARAWRSPWIWLEPLDKQRDALFGAPGKPEIVGMIQLEALWRGLGFLKDRYGLRTLNVQGTIHANKCLTYGGVHWSEYWRGACIYKHLLDGSMGISGGTVACGQCAACAIGVVDEAYALGYFKA